MLAVALQTLPNVAKRAESEFEEVCNGFDALHCGRELSRVRRKRNCCSTLLPQKVKGKKEPPKSSELGGF